MRSTTLEIKERLEIGLYRMPDDQGPKYFSSAEKVRLLASDWLAGKTAQQRVALHRSQMTGTRTCGCSDLTGGITVTCYIFTRKRPLGVYKCTAIKVYCVCICPCAADIGYAVPTSHPDMFFSEFEEGW